MTTLQLAVALKKSWSKDTSSDPHNWSWFNKAWGQCAITACIIQDYLGGEIVWALATTPDGTQYSHYFNRLEAAQLIDATRDQFPPHTKFEPADGCERKGAHQTTRDYVLSNPETRERYGILKARVGMQVYEQLSESAARLGVTTEEVQAFCECFRPMNMEEIKRVFRQIIGSQTRRDKYERSRLPDR